MHVFFYLTIHCYSCMLELRKKCVHHTLEKGGKYVTRSWIYEFNRKDNRSKMFTYSKFFDVAI